jgi:hypothetical protein
LQTAVPQQVIAGVAGNPVIAALALMALAFVLSLCSEADAFVAASFVQFGVGAQMAFLVFGPILDIKLAFLYSATFRQRFVTRLLLVSVPVCRLDRVIACGFVFSRNPRKAPRTTTCATTGASPRSGRPIWTPRPSNAALVRSSEESPPWPAPSMAR